MGVIARLVPYQNAGCDWCNVSTTERWITGAAGLALAGLGIAEVVRGRQRSQDDESLRSAGAGADAAAETEADRMRADTTVEGYHRTAAALALAGGGALLARAVSGFCPVYALLGRGSSGMEWPASTDLATRRTLSGNRGFRVRESVTIDRPAAEVYEFWRRFENLPRFMQHLESVRMLDGLRSHWVARGPAGTTVEWDAEIVNEEPGKVIGWRTLPEAETASAGSVHFDETADGGTELTVSLQYQPPAGVIGVAVARMFGEEPSQQIRDDLQRLKVLLEARDVPKAGNQ